MVTPQRTKESYQDEVVNFTKKLCTNSLLLTAYTIHIKIFYQMYKPKPNQLRNFYETLLQKTLNHSLKYQFEISLYTFSLFKEVQSNHESPDLSFNICMHTLIPLLRIGSHQGVHLWPHTANQLLL